MENQTDEQSNSRPWLYKKGQSGNPNGRPKGSISMKQWVKNKLLGMTPEEREVFLEGVPKVEIWKLAEGNPETRIDSDVNLKVERLEDLVKATRELLK
jgi:hypothetical protein